ncbi:MAG: HDIG domain-containing protein [Deltaproteobacteria bacterium]|nr:HDIG domain-containing protein [Deltaproteobacteria bacterium]
MKAGGRAARPPRRKPDVPDKEPDKISRMFGLGSRWRRGNRTAARKPRTARDENLLKISLLLGLSLILAGLLTPWSPKPLRTYQVGDIAQENIKAVGDFLVEDGESTAQRRRELLAQIPPVFDLDEQVGEKAKERLLTAMDFMRRKFQELSQVGAFPGSPNPVKPKFSTIHKALGEQKPEFDRLLGATLPNPTFHLLAKAEFSPYLEALVIQMLDQFFQKGVIGSRAILNPEPKEIVLRRLPSKTEQEDRAPYPFVDLEEARKAANLYCRDLAPDSSPQERFLVCDLAQYLLSPNVSPNLAETQTRQQARLQELRPAYFQVKRGEMLVREGERLTTFHLAKLEVQSRIYPRSRGLFSFLGIFLSLGLLLAVAYRLGRASLKSFPHRLRDLFFLSALLLAGTCLNKGLLIVGETISRVRPEMGQNLVYALPLALAPMFAAMFLGLEAGAGLAFLSAILTALLLGKPFPFFLYFAVAGLMGVWGVRHVRNRGALIQAGLFISFSNLAMVTAFKLLEYPVGAGEMFIGQAFAVSGGLLTGILALGLTPIMESAFNYTSNIRLLELLNLHQPILRDLMLVAPGTYHHSLVVGQMVEAAAEAIDANPLMAKAAAYYHDIGKVKKPGYFVENQVGGENKHEKLAPSMSSLILISHVKDGVELARKNKLGEGIEAIIRQHHGTGFITYFYHKAKDQAANPQQVNVDDFRYPGPRPQTKEAGLVLLADQVEAASKTLTDPTPARIQGMVQKIINKVFADGQLDECELTLKDLHLIAKSFNKILSGIFHQRIHYPQPVEKKKAHEDLDKQPAKKNNNKSGEAAEKGREDLKRLGMG